METINIVAKSRKGLINYIESRVGTQFPASGIFIYIKRDDCGCEFVYPQKEDVPNDNVTCVHGNKIIVYEQAD